MILPNFFPSLKLFFFVPFLIIVFYKKPLVSALWLSLFCGLFVDLVGDQQYLGLYSLNYCLCTLLLYPQKRHFFRDKVTTIPLMTFFFSVVSTLIQVFLVYSFEIGIPLSWKWVGTDLLAMPALDALYGYFFFTLPNVFLPQAAKREYFLNK